MKDTSSRLGRSSRSSSPTGTFAVGAGDDAGRRRQVRRVRAEFGVAVARCATPTSAAAPVGGAFAWREDQLPESVSMGERVRPSLADKLARLIPLLREELFKAPAVELDATHLAVLEEVQ